MKHTETPWKQSANMIVRYGEDGAIICQMSEPFAQYVEHRELGIGSKHWDYQMNNAQFIITACNYHDRLIEALNNIGYTHCQLFTNQAGNEEFRGLVMRLVNNLLKEIEQEEEN